MDKGYQVEDGYIRISTEILISWRTANFTSREWIVIHYIIEKTYGWHKKTDRISVRQIANDTGLHYANIAKTINRLLDANVLYRVGGKRGQLGYQKYSTKWKLDILKDARKPKKRMIQEQHNVYSIR